MCLQARGARSEETHVGLKGTKTSDFAGFISSLRFKLWFGIIASTFLLLFNAMRTHEEKPRACDQPVRQADFLSVPHFLPGFL